MLTSARRLRPLSRSNPGLLPPRRRSSPSARSGCPGTSTHGKWRSSTTFRRARPVRSCEVNCVRRNRRSCAASGNHTHASYDPVQLGSVLDVWHRSALHRPQRAQRRLLRLGQSFYPADIEALVGPVAPQRPQMLAALEIPDADGTVIAATGQRAPIGTPSERLNRPLMPLPKRQALPALHVPPAYAPIAATTEQHRCGRTPGQRVHDRARLAPGLQALPTGHLPDEDLPAASSTPTAAGQPRAI